MARYRKLPVVVDAWEVRELLETARLNREHHARHDHGMPTPVGRAMEVGTLLFTPDAILVNTLEGQMVAGRFAYLLRGVKGEFYPCDREIFERTYAADEPLQPGEAWELRTTFRTRGAPEDLNCVRWSIDPLGLDGRAPGWVPDVRLVREEIHRVTTTP